MSIRVIGVVALLLVVTGFAFAQGDRGTITGTVNDASGAVLPGVSIVATNTETGTRSETVTTETGNYTLAQMPVGSYELTAELPGFKRYIQQGIRVPVAQTLRIDVSLQVGANTEEITVNADAPLLSTESGSISHTIAAQRLVDLGLLGIGGTYSSSQGLRFYQTEIQLIPGASVPVAGFIAGVRVNGAPNGTQRTQIDGMDSTNSINAVQAGTGISVDAMQETAIQTSNFAPEFGAVGGGLFNITTRSGTNRFHGAGYDYLANEAFNAATPFTATATSNNIRPRIRRNDYGFNFGGPLSPPKLYNGTDRSFFFFNFEQFREFFVTNDLNITVPTDAYRAGNFSSALTGRTLGTDPLGRPILEGQIFDPTKTQIVNGLIVRDPFPGNIIPPERFDKVALAIQKLIPAPTSPNLVALNYRPSFPNDRVTTNWSVKLDHQISPKAKISGLYLTNWSNAQYSQSLNGSEGLPATITATRGTFSRSRNWRLNFDYTLSNTKLLHLGAGLLLYQLNDHSPTTDFDDSTIGLAGVPNPGRRFPTIGGLCNTGLGTTVSPCTGTGGMMNMGPGVNGGQSLTKQMTPSFQASLTDVKGNHTFKYGSELRIFGYPYLSLAAANGVFNFSPNQTAQLSTNAGPVSSATIGGGTVGFAYASFLLGLVDNGIANPAASLRTGKHFISFFAQDSWKVTRKLTLDYGLRYDYFTHPKEQYGRQPTVSPTVGNPTAGGIPGGIIYEATCKCSFAKNYPYAFGPRVGLAYQFAEKTVFRMGIGIAYDGTATGSTGTMSAAPSNTFRAPGFGSESMTLASGVPQAYVLPWPNLSAGSYPNPNFPAVFNGPPNVVDPNAGRPARQVQWSFGIQREVIKDLVVDAAYVGNRGAWWLSTTLVNYNALTPETLLAKGLDLNNAADLVILRAPINSAAAGRFQNKLPYPTFPVTSTVAQSLRPYPQFNSGLAPLWAPIGRTWYDSLQLKVTKRVSHGLDVLYAFTWAKELQMGTESVQPTPVINGLQNRDANKTISGFGRPFVSVISANYRLPAWGPNKVVSQVVRDWAIGATMSYASGLPILAPTSTNNLNNLLFQWPSTAGNTAATFVNRVPGVSPFLKDLNCHCIDPTKDLVLNPAAWTNPADGQFGTGAPYYNDYRYQRRPSESMSLGRVFKFREHEGMALTVRMNFQNIFNRTEMQNPASTNISAPKTTGPNGQLTGGFGFINYVGGSTFQPPRQGTLEMRLQF
jgi:Carboxypeptidase regulatory-like domain/TonB dependent receptor-like, beta-barrel